jgi:hypothetical protein
VIGRELARERADAPSARVRKRDLLEPERDQRKGVFDAVANTWV